MSNVSFEAGALIRGQIRRELDRAKWEGGLEDYKELKGFLSSEFLLRGPSPSVLRWLKAVEKELEERRA